MKKQLLIFAALLNNKTNIIIIILAIILGCNASCYDKDSMDYHINTGLENYERKRRINDKLNEDISIEYFSIFKIKKDCYRLVFKLDEYTNVKAIRNYTLALHAFVNKEYLKDKPYLLLDYKPELIKSHKFNYLIKDFTTKSKRIDSLDLFLYDRDKYRTILGKKITIRNIGL